MKNCKEELAIIYSQYNNILKFLFVISISYDLGIWAFHQLRAKETPETVINESINGQKWFYRGDNPDTNAIKDYLIYCITEK